ASPLSLSCGMASPDMALPDMASPDMALPDMAQHLAAQMLPAGFTIGHQALAGREHCHAHATEDARDPVSPRVDAQPGLGDPLDPGDGARAVGRVLQGDLQRRARLVAV